MSVPLLQTDFCAQYTSNSQDVERLDAANEQGGVAQDTSAAAALEDHGGRLDVANLHC